MRLSAPPDQAEASAREDVLPVEPPLARAPDASGAFPPPDDWRQSAPGRLDLRQQFPRLHHIGSHDAVAKLLHDTGQQSALRLRLSATLRKPGQADCSPQFPRERTLLAGQLERIVEQTLGRLGRAWRTL